MTDAETRDRSRKEKTIMNGLIVVALEMLTNVLVRCLSLTLKSYYAEYDSYAKMRRILEKGTYQGLAGL